jgi:hypothetical protein
MYSQTNYQKNKKEKTIMWRTKNEEALDGKESGTLMSIKGRGAA